MMPNTISLDTEMMNEERSKILRWVIEWLKYPKGSLNSNNIDASELASLMQCLGFTLENFEKVEQENSEVADEGCIKIEIMCHKSKLKACLTKPLMMCNCPSKDDAHNARIWNVSGCEPQSEERINVSNASILPTVSPTKNRVIGELLQKILQLINDPEVDKRIQDHPETRNRSLVRHKSLETLKVNACVANLNTNPVWESPAGSPPKLTSSPLPECCISLKDTPNPSKTNNNQLSVLLQKIIQISEEAYDLVTSSDHNLIKKRLSDIKVSPLVNDAYTPCKGTFINMNLTHTKEFSTLMQRATPRKAYTPKKNTPTQADKKKMMPPPSKLSLPRKKPIGLLGREQKEVTPGKTKNLTPKADTPRPTPKYTSIPKVTFNTPSAENTPMGVSKLRTGIPKRK